MELQLNGKRALVTGSSAGIGAAIARHLAGEGARVIAHGRNPARTEATVAAIRAAGGEAAFVLGDLGSDEGARVVSEGARHAFGGIDILINNHGVYFERGWRDTTPADWAEIYNQNVVAFVRMVQHFGPRMRDVGWGRVINISSGGGWQPFANMADYTATKAAILNLTVSLAKEFAGTGITVNTVSPGIIVTESTEQYFRKVAADQGWPAEWAEIEKRVIANFLPNSSGRLGKPADVANVVALIASPLSDFLNGGNYRVDGGSTVSIN